MTQRYFCSSYDGGVRVKPFQACMVMAFLATRSRAFHTITPAPASGIRIRKPSSFSSSSSSSSSSLTSPSSQQNALRGSASFPQLLLPAITPTSRFARHALRRPDSPRQARFLSKAVGGSTRVFEGAKSCSSQHHRGRRSSSLCLGQETDASGAKDGAYAAVEASANELDREAEDASGAAVGEEVQAAVAAARAAARSAMGSLREGFDREKGSGGTVSSGKDVTSPARAAVEAALSAIAEAETTDSIGTLSGASSTAKDAVGMVQAALERRDVAAKDLAFETAHGDARKPRPTSASDVDVSPEDDSESAGTSVGEGGEKGGKGEVADEEEEPTKEPESARRTRNNPVASHSHMSHLLWKQVAGPGDTVVDCTAGNGYDSVELAKIVGLNDGIGKMYIMDVQKQALDSTRARLDSELGEIAVKRSVFMNANFRELPADLKPMSVPLIVYNLGWLPGGDKSITTNLEDTIASIDSAKRLIKSGGMISVMLYAGHTEGKREADGVREYAAGLTHYQWRVFVHERANRSLSPMLVTIYRL